MVAVKSEEVEQMRSRNAEYVQHRMKLPISDEQYLFWDNILTNHYEEAIEVYTRLLSYTNYMSRNRCFDTGLESRMKLKAYGKTLYAHRFTYVIRVSLPLSTKQVVRHQCANYRCLNPAHLEVGDQAQNFQDFLAARANGVRWDLLPRNPLDTIR